MSQEIPRPSPDDLKRFEHFLERCTARGWAVDDSWAHRVAAHYKRIWNEQVQYSIQLQQMIEDACGDRELIRFPDLHHHSKLKALVDDRDRYKAIAEDETIGLLGIGTLAELSRATTRITTLEDALREILIIGAMKNIGDEPHTRLLEIRDEARRALTQPEAPELLTTTPVSSKLVDEAPDTEEKP